MIDQGFALTRANGIFPMRLCAGSMHGNASMNRCRESVLSRPGLKRLIGAHHAGRLDARRNKIPPGWYEFDMDALYAAARTPGPAPQSRPASSLRPLGNLLGSLFANWR